jgi:hypothetical protein
MEEMKTEMRLLEKNRLCWLLTLIGALVIGVAYYFWIIDQQIFFYMTFFSIFVFAYTVICELATRTTYTFWFKSTFVLPLGLAIAYVCQSLFPRPWFTLNPIADPYPFGIPQLIQNYVFLMFASFVVGAFATLVTRLARGYEANTSGPLVTSYLMEEKCDDALPLMEAFLRSLNIDYTVMVGKDFKYIIAPYHPNRHYLFPKQFNANSVEIDFVTVKIQNETLIAPDQKSTQTFLAYFETFLNNKVKDNKPVKWTTDFKPQNSEFSRMTVWKNLWVPLRIKQRLALRSEGVQKPLNFIISNKKAIFTFIGGIAVAVIAQIILHYFGLA